MLEKTRENMLGMALRVAAEPREKRWVGAVLQPPVAAAVAAGAGAAVEAAVEAPAVTAPTVADAARDVPGDQAVTAEESGDGEATVEPLPQVLSPAIRMSPGTRRSIDLDPSEPEGEASGDDDAADTPPDPDDEQGEVGEGTPAVASASETGGVASWRRVRASYAAPPSPQRSES